MEAARTSKILAIAYLIKRRHIPDENSFYNRRLDVIKSLILKWI